MHTIPLTDLEFDAALIARYDDHGPRYTSYPTADRFQARSFASEFVAQVQKRHAAGASAPLSIYVHIPFCDTVCYYCACNKIATRHKHRADPYLDDLERELALIQALFDSPPVVSQLHFGGGTPTFLTYSQMQRLLEMLHAAFAFSDDAECSIEIDPRRLQEGTLDLLRQYGFNRMSIGVQDVDPAVQVAINRIQPVDCTQTVLEQARALGFRSINMDLIYGLPQQTTQTMAQTLQTVVQWRPDRIALYSYAHLPERFKPQRRIDSQTMPSAAEKLAMLQLAVTTLLKAGYVYIGMDHFALPEDELARALQDGSLQRNFQGYATRADCDLIALGVSGISRVGTVYSQNARTTEEYKQLLDRGVLPTVRGFEMDRDDEIRRDVIHALLCQSRLDFERLNQTWGIDCQQYFADEMTGLTDLLQDGLIDVDHHGLSITPKGRFLARAVAKRFDQYLRQNSSTTHFSKVI